MRLSSKFLEMTNRSNERFPFYIYKLGCEKDKSAIISHWHEDLEILYALNRGVAEINGVAIQFEENEIIFINKEQIHSVISFSSGYMYALVFNYKFLDFKQNDFCQSSIINNLRGGQLLFPNKISKDCLAYSEINKNIIEIIELYFSSIVGKELKIKSNLYNIIFLCYTNKQFNNDKDLTIDNKMPQLAYIKSTIRYMEENISSNITIKDLAMNVNLSEFYLIKLFKQFAGTTPLVYLTNLRFENSIELLTDGYSVTQTAYEVGFNNLSYFIRIFKKKYNLTPRNFQKNIIK